MKNLVLEAKSESHGRASRRSLRHKVQGARHKEKGEKSEKGGKGKTGETRALNSRITEACRYVIPAQAGIQEALTILFSGFRISPALCGLVRNDEPGIRGTQV
ncbi:MAG: hypothetical protein PVI73_16390 [Syntrophobacterales bacterium]|jgi:hypothetical protein